MSRVLQTDDTFHEENETENNQTPINNTRLIPIDCSYCSTILTKLKFPDENVIVVVSCSYCFDLQMTHGKARSVFIWPVLKSG